MPFLDRYLIFIGVAYVDGSGGDNREYYDEMARRT